MRKKQKRALLIGLGIMALVLIAVVVIIIATIKPKPDIEEPKPDTFVVSVEVIGENYGKYEFDSVTNVHNAGTSPTYTFTPNANCGIVSVEIDGEEKHSYLTDAEIDIQDAFSFIFENISANHTVKVVFDQLTTLSGLNYETVLEGGSSGDTTVYGEFVPWGKSQFVFVNYPAKLTIVAKTNYAFYGFKMPKETIENDLHLMVDDFNYSVAYDLELMGQDPSGVTGADSQILMKYVAEEGSFLVSKLPGVFAPYLEGKLTLHFKPNEIDLKIYSIASGELSDLPEFDTTQEDYSGSSFALFDIYSIPYDFKDYKWYVAKNTSSNKDILECYLENPVEVKEGLTEGEENTFYYIELLPEYYADSEDSRLICLVYVIE